MVEDQKVYNSYMSSYVMDTMCKHQNFLGMGWEWKLTSLPIHVYFLDLWDTRYEYDYQMIYNHFFKPLRTIISCESSPCMSQEAKNIISRIGDWYISLSGVYLSIFHSQNPSHQLLHYTPNHLVLVEVAYQIYVSIFATAMIRKKKLTWSKFPLQIGVYNIANVKQVIAEEEILPTYFLLELPFY